MSANLVEARLPFAETHSDPAEPEPLKRPRISAPIQVYGSGRSIASPVGRLLDGLGWVGIPCCGGLSELGEITAPTIIASDLNEFAINFYRVVKNAKERPWLIERLKRRLFHAAELTAAQEFLKKHGVKGLCDLKAAEAYFMCLWMTRAGIGLTSQELDGSLSFRWDNGVGGDSLVRWESAIGSLPWWGEQFHRCHFLLMDCFELLAKTKDGAAVGLYVDPPFPKVGRKYRHNAGGTQAEELAWHTRLRNELARFNHTRVVARFYDHDLIRELYPADVWTWHWIEGRDQHNQAKSEVLITNNTGGV